ncbi:MAG: carboxylesterase family protein [Terriglobales bacterium]
MRKGDKMKNGFAFKLLFGVAALCVFTLSTTSAAFGTSPTVTTPLGVVIGKKALGMDEYLGIPYALPPVGELRWTPPQPYGVFPTEPFVATEFGNPCVQAAGGSENCLFLNIFTPSTGGTGLPVMVWFHGGGLIEGSSTAYNPELLVKKGVIVVTLNYRLGYLGFFAQSAIDAEGHTNGNYGLMDQQLALQWVQNNIAAFGGNPAQVTIFGQSAGGQSVYANLASPTAAGTFSGAISESGSYDEFQPYLNDVIPVAAAETTAGVEAEEDTAVPSGEYIANAVGCGDPATSACLRAVPATSFVALQPFPIFPFVDGTVLTQTITQAFATGSFNKVPVISGTNRDEYDLFVAEQFDFQGNPLTESTYPYAVDALFPAALAPTVLEIYPYNYDATPDQSLGAAATDGGFSCPVWNANQSLSQYVSTYAYEFADENAPPAEADFGGLLTFPLGAYHAAEIQYLFEGYDIFGLPASLTTLSATQKRLSTDMVDYWTQFAKTGNPNVEGKPVWPGYNASTDLFLQLTEPKPVAISSFKYEHLCSFLWNQIP